VYDHAALRSGKFTEEIYLGLVSILQHWTGENERKALRETINE
jgi:hypothetical protein